MKDAQSAVSYTFPLELTRKYQKEQTCCYIGLYRAACF